MSTITSLIEFDSAEMAWISCYAKRGGSSISDMVREWTLQRLEDEFDAYGLVDVMTGEDGLIHALPE